MIPKKQSLDSISYKKDKGKFSFSLIGSIVLLRHSTIIKKTSSSSLSLTSPILLVNEGEVVDSYIENGRKHLVYASVMNFM